MNGVRRDRVSVRRARRKRINHDEEGIQVNAKEEGLR